MSERKPSNMSDERRTEFVAFKVTPKEKRKVERDAKKQGMDTSNYARWKMIYEDAESKKK